MEECLGREGTSYKNVRLVGDMCTWFRKGIEQVEERVSSESERRVGEVCSGLGKREDGLEK